MTFIILSGCQINVETSSCIVTLLVYLQILNLLSFQVSCILYVTHLISASNDCNCDCNYYYSCYYYFI